MLKGTVINIMVKCIPKRCERSRGPNIVETSRTMKDEKMSLGYSIRDLSGEVEQKPEYKQGKERTSVLSAIKDTVNAGGVGQI